MTSTRPRTFCEAFQLTAAAHPDLVAVRTPDAAVSITWREYADRVRRIAAGLAGLGVRRGDTVALMMTNRPEFHLVDTGALHAGATPFSIYNTFAPEQITHLLANAGAKVVICEEQFLERLRAADPGGQLEVFVCVDGHPEGTITLDEIETWGSSDFDFETSWRAVEPEDLLTIVYTSGTTGPPKGVEITHAGALAGMAALDSLLPQNYSDRVISYLSDAHIANRWGVHYNNLWCGIQITTVDDYKKLITALPTIRPTFFAAVPQIWYKLEAAIEAAIDQEPNPIKKRLARWAIDVGIQIARQRSEGRTVAPYLRAQHAIADRLVLSALRAKLGLGEVRTAASGAAAIAPDALAFVLGLGLPVAECWGMSETSAVVIINPPDAIRIGTVGKAMRGTEIRLAEDGELLVRTPTLMKGYRNDPAKTAEAIDDDGWLHTGDIATLDADGYVEIVDRKKELIINAAGKNMSPSNIEGTVTVCCPLVGSVMAIGDDRPYIVALLTLDVDACAAYAKAHDLPDASPAALAKDPQVRALLETGIAQANLRLARVEQIKKFVVLPAIWEPGGDELTPTVKLKRKPIAAKYASDIEGLYAS